MICLEIFLVMLVVVQSFNQEAIKRLLMAFYFKGLLMYIYVPD